MRTRTDPGWGALVLRLAEVVALLTPLEAAVTFSGLGSLPKLATGLLIVLFILSFARRRRFEDTKPFGFILFAHVGWLMLSSIWASDPKEASFRLQLLVQLALFGVVFCQLANSPRQRARIALAFGIGTTIASFIVISNWLNNVSYLGYGIGVEATVDNTGEIARFTVGGEDPNHIATMIAVGTVLIYWGGWELFRRRGRLLCCGAIAIMFFGALLTGSRGSSVLAPTAVALYLAWVRLRRDLAKFIGTVILAGLVGVVVWSFLPTSTKVRMSTSFDGNQATSKLRQEIWIAGIHAWQDQPLHGVGIGSYAPAVRDELSKGLVAHNTLLNEMVEQGLIGLAISLAPIILIWRRAGLLDEYRQVRARALLIMYLVTTLGLSLELKKVTFLVFALLAAEVRAIRLRAPALGTRENLSGSVLQLPALDSRGTRVSST
jgi:O-antigen ligase